MHTHDPVAATSDPHEKTNRPRRFSDATVDNLTALHLNSFTIRESTSADAATLADLKREVEDRTYIEFGTAAEHRSSLSRFCGTEYIQHLQARGVVLIAEDERGVVGMIAYRVAQSVVELSGDYQRRRGCGSGTALLLAAIEESADEALVRIEVFSSNLAARAFFSRRGFRETGRSRPSESYSSQRLIEMVTRAADIRSAALTARRSVSSR